MEGGHEGALQATDGCNETHVVGLDEALGLLATHPTIYHSQLVNASVL